MNDPSLSTSIVPFSDDVRAFVGSARWRFAKTYAATWPHDYVVRNDDNADMILALARHIFDHGVDGRFYSQIRKYHHEHGRVYWSMDPTPEETTLINRCDESQTYEARLAAGTLPDDRATTGSGRAAEAANMGGDQPDWDLYERAINIRPLKVFHLDHPMPPFDPVTRRTAK